MKSTLITKFLLCLFSLGLCMYLHVEKQNAITKLRLQLPQVAKQTKLIKEEISQLQYEIEQFESPAHLMELAHLPEYSHLKHPFLKDIATFPEALAFGDEKEKQQNDSLSAILLFAND
jgi:septal ring factor EnvC (AmiA/AmiB activator)